MIAAGLALAAWSAAEMRPSPPPQVAPVVGASWEPLVSAPDIGRLTPEQTVNLQAVSYTTTPARGDRIGTITLPTLDLNWPIYEGTTGAELSQGVGHFIDSVLPGIRDNTVLSGHRTTVFGRLGELAEGDLIHVGTSAGEFTYQVREFRIVPRTSLDVIVPTTTAVLTITTCYPFYSLIQTTEAFIVSADLVASQLTPE